MRGVVGVQRLVSHSACKRSGAIIACVVCFIWAQQVFSMFLLVCLYHVFGFTQQARASRCNISFCYLVCVGFARALDVCASLSLSIARFGAANTGVLMQLFIAVS